MIYQIGRNLQHQGTDGRMDVLMGNEKGMESGWDSVKKTIVNFLKASISLLVYTLFKLTHSPLARSVYVCMCVCLCVL